MQFANGAYRSRAINQSMLYDIYFHNDFDGRASAAVVLRFLRDRGDDVGHLTPVNYDVLPQWLHEDFFKRHTLFKGKRNPPIIVDFPYHPKAAFWFEHHPTTFKKEIWRKKFKETNALRYDPSYKSACHLTYAALKEGFGWKPPAHFKELVAWLDIIDGANYRSARQTLELKEPALQVSAFIDRLDNTIAPDIDSWIIGLLASRPLGEIAKEPAIKRSTAKTKKEIALALAWYRKHFAIDGRVGFVDLTAGKVKRFRFAAYYLHPKLPYCIRMTKYVAQSGRGYHLNVGVNPWVRSEAHVHIGEMLKRYGGGGHKTVGGVEFKTRKEAVKAAEEMLAILNR